MCPASVTEVSCPLASVLFDELAAPWESEGLEMEPKLHSEVTRNVSVPGVGGRRARGL